MPVVGLYEFDDTDLTVRDGALGNGAQNGVYLHGAVGSGGALQLDGDRAYAKITADDAFQLSRGTIDFKFVQDCQKAKETETVLSRDAAGQTEGGLRIEVTAAGAVRVIHETADGSAVFTTPDGLVRPGDPIHVTYSWNSEGGGALRVNNVNTTAVYEIAIPDALTLDMGPVNPPFILGASSADTPPGTLENIGDNFDGRMLYLKISDDAPAGPDGIVRGTPGADMIDLAYIDTDGDRIDAGDNIFAGRGPNDDIVVAGPGNDTVLAGDGDDEVYGGSGNDSLDGGAGDDTLVGGSGNDRADGGDGDDLIDTSAPPGLSALPDRGYPGLYPADTDPGNDLDTVYGGAGNDTIATGDDADLIFGGSGRDLIFSGIDDDTVHGDGDNDTIIAGEGSDLVYGGDGDDSISGGLGPGVPDLVNIPDATDLRPDNGRDTLYGGAGNDTIRGEDDNDALYGDEGNDLLDGGIDNDSLFGGEGDDTLTGGDGDDMLTGGDGTDVMTGGADRDTFTGVTPGDTIDGNEEGDDFDTLDLRGSGPLRVTLDGGNPENGVVTFLNPDGTVRGTATFQNIENIVPCFTPGTLIATPRGEVAVETLKAGDKIVTRDNGIQTVRWVGQKHMDWKALAANPHLKPVLIRAGSLGNGLPERDMLVSPNHRVLVANDRTSLYFDEHEVLVAAKHLVGGAGVASIDAAGITYVHFMCDRHEVVLSNGAWTESFQPGDYTLRGMGNAQRNEIFEIFPELKSAQGQDDYIAARRTLRRHEAMLLVR
jgi:Ca2+-binding RTX toxin-like protein